MQTISWILLIVNIVVAGGLWYLRKWIIHAWDTAVDRFYRKIMTEEDFAQKVISWFKGLIRPFTGVSLTGFILLISLMLVANIVSIQKYHAMLLDFPQTLWALFAPVQLIAWSLAESVVGFFSLFGMTRPVTDNPDSVEIFYYIVCSFVVGGIFWLVFPFEDKIGIKAELGTVEEVAAAQKTNRNFRNFIRFVGIAVLFAVLYVNDTFDKTLVPMWSNPGLERIGEIFGHYTEQAMEIDVTPEPTVMTPTEYGYEQTGKSGGTAWWVWALIALAVLVVGAAFYFLILPRLRGKGGNATGSIMAENEGDFSRNKLDEPFERLNGAKEPYNNFLRDAFLLSTGLREGHVANEHRETVQAAIDKLPALIKALHAKIESAKRPYSDFQSDFAMVDIIVKNKLEGDLSFDQLTRKALNTFIATCFHALKQANRYTGWQDDIAFLENALQQPGWIGDTFRDNITQTIADAKKRFA